MGQVFAEAEGSREAEKIRENTTEDIVVRHGVITPDRIILHNYPISSPTTLFNPSIIYNPEEESLTIYARIIFGYYMYVSSIVEFSIPLSDLTSKTINTHKYTGNIVVYPSVKHDVWGAEDPRVYRFNDALAMTYVGRTINYFNPAIRRNRTIPITAFYDESRKTWSKRFVFSLSKEFGEVISNKDAFLHESPDGSLYLLHRPHMADETYHLLASTLNDRVRIRLGGLEEVVVDNGVEVLRPTGFEGKLGWAAPLLKRKDRLITLIHATDKDDVVYRVFAAEITLRRDEVAVEAVTPRYIMEPSTPYEIMGERPMVVFPCGAAKITDDLYAVSYGASDYMVGVGTLSLNRLLSELDKGRIY